MKENNWIKTKIGVGSVVKSKVREMEDNTREVRIRSMSKEVLGCVQDVLGKKRSLVQFEYEYKKDMIYVSLSYVC